MKPRDLELFSCFTTLALHLEPRGRRSLPPRSCRERVPTGSPTSQHAHRGEQLGQSLVQTGQVGGGRDEVLGVHGSCGKTGTGEFSCFPLSPRTEFMMFCEWFWWSSKADCGEFPQVLTGAWNSIFSLKSKIEMWICDKYWQVISLFVQVKHVVASVCIEIDCPQNCCEWIWWVDPARHVPSIMKLFLRNPSFGCRYQIGPNSFDWVVGSQQ